MALPNVPMTVKVHLLLASEPVVHHDVRNTYQKGAMFCVMREDLTVYKYPMDHIFRIVESSPYEACVNPNCECEGTCPANEDEDEYEDEGDYGVGLQGKGVDEGSAHALILEVDVEGKVGTTYVSPLFFESLREYWDAETRKRFGMSYDECLIEDRRNFNIALKKS